MRLEDKYIKPHVDASKDDGLYVVDLESGECRLVASMRHIAKKTGLDVDFPTYGFHTKWNADGTRIMFVIRQFRQRQGVAGWFGFGVETRRNHIVTMDPDGNNMKVECLLHKVVRLLKQLLAHGEMSSSPARGGLGVRRR